MKWVFLILGVLLLSLSAVVATDQVVVNAKDWREFYSVAVYSSLENSSFNFFSDSVNIQTFKETKFGLTSQDNITIFNGKGYYISGLKSIIEAGGFSVNQVYEGIENLNYYIGDELLHDIQNFVIISDSKSRAALGAIPYVLESDRKSVV